MATRAWTLQAWPSRRNSARSEPKAANVALLEEHLTKRLQAPSSVAGSKPPQFAHTLSSPLETLGADRGQYPQRPTGVGQLLSCRATADFQQHGRGLQEASYRTARGKTTTGS